MQIITETELLERIDAFLLRHDMAPTTFGRKATGEPQLIDSIRNNGRSPSLRVVNRVVAFMDEQDRALRANPPPLELTAPVEQEERELPFVKAPVSRTGASSRTSSKIVERLPPSAANGTCQCLTPAHPEQMNSCSVADHRPKPTHEPFDDAQDRES